VGLDALGELIGPRFFRREPRARALAYVKALGCGSSGVTVPMGAGAIWGDGSCVRLGRVWV
jgi:hypothetical protein